METKLWVLSGIIALLVPLAVWAIKSTVASIIKELRAIAAELVSIKLSLNANTQDLHHVKEQVADHESRIRTLERNT